MHIEVKDDVAEVDELLKVESVDLAEVMSVSNVDTRVSAEAKAVAFALSSTFCTRPDIWPNCTAEASVPNPPSPKVTNDWAF